MGTFLPKWLRDRFVFAGEAAERASVLAVGSPNQAAPAAEMDQTVAGDINVLAGSASKALTIARKEIPKPDDPDGLVAYIKSWRAQLRPRGIVNDLAYTIVDNFRLKGTPELQQWAYQQRLYTKLQRIALDLTTIGWCVVYVSEDPKAPPALMVLHNVSVKRDVLGNEVIYLQLTDDAKEAIQKNPGSYPSYWSQYLDQESGINITRTYDSSGKLTQGGAYFISIGSDSEDVLPVPPVFPYLGMSVDGERVSEQMGAYVDMVKHYLIHAKVGDKVGADLRDGRPKPPTKERLNSILNSLSVGFRSGALVTPSDVDVNITIPEGDPFAVIRNTRTGVMDELRAVLGTPDFSDVQSEGAGALLARGFLPSLHYIRHACIEDQLLRPLLADMASQSRIPGADAPRFLWSDDVSFDLGTRINLVKQKAATGGYSIRTLCESLDPDYNQDAEFEQKQIEQKSIDVIGNIYEPAQGVCDKALQQQEAAPESSDPVDSNTDAPEGKPAPAAKKRKGKAPTTAPSADGGRPPK